MSRAGGPAVELEQVSKRYTPGGWHGWLSGQRAHQPLWALRDVTLRVAPGESVGLIGHNGAGKTTLLRLLAGITRPSAGRVHTRGRVASLINLGAGFHPELTGRENIYLNGVILGLSRAEVRSRFDDIVAFADLGAYIDTPLKRYSSGMYARLGFAVAAYIDPDVLLVDEVLSVGDVGFQERSIRKMLSFRDAGRAILFVSHNLSAVEMMCQRTIWLDHGQIRQVGPTAEVVRAYLDAVDATLIGEVSGTTTPASDAADVEVEQVQVFDRAGGAREDFTYGEPLGIRLRCRATRDLEQVRCTLTVRGDYGPLFSAASHPVDRWQHGMHGFECVFDELPLLPGLYRIDLSLDWSGASPSVPRSVAAFRVVTDLDAFGSQSVVGATKSRGGFLAVAYDWQMHSSAGDQVLPGLRLPTTMGASRHP